ncbi:Hypothetical predicted protein, partial [Paramuricea clavata]
MDSRPLLQKEYPKVQRTSDNDEKQVIEKLKASLLRLNSNSISSLGNYNPDEVFENIKSILKLLINYPMTLADPSADAGEGKSSGLILSKRQTLVQDSLADTQSLRSSCGEIANEQPIVPQCQTTSRLPAFALEAAKSTGTNSNKSLAKSGIPLIEENNVPTSEHVKSSVTNKIREFLDSSSGEDNVLPSRSQRLAKKIPDSKQSLSSSSTDDERNTKTKPGMKPTSEYYNESPTNLITPDPSSTSSMKYQPERSSSTASDTIGFRQIESNNDDFPVQQDRQKRHSNDETTIPKTKQYTSGIPSTNGSSHLTASMRPASEPLPRASFVNKATLSRISPEENAYSSRDDNSMIHPLVELPNSLKQCSGKEVIHVIDKQNVVGRRDDSVTRSSCWSGVENGEQVPLSSTVNATSECVPLYSDTIGQSSCKLHSSRRPAHGDSLLSLSRSTSLKVSETRRLSPSSSDQEVAGILGKDVHRGNGDTTQIYDLLNNLNQQNSTTGSYSYFPLSPSNVNTASLELQELTINNNLASAEGNSYSQSTTSSPRSYADIPYPILNAGGMPSPRLFSREIEDRECPLPASKQTMPNQHPQSSLNVNREIKSTPSARNVDDKRTKLPNEHKQYTFPQQDMEGMKTKEHSLSNQTLLDQPIPWSSLNGNFQHNKKLSNVNSQNILDISEPKVSEQRQHSSNQLSQASFHNSWPTETAASNKGYDFSSQSVSNTQLPKAQPTLLQKHWALDQTDKLDNIGQGNLHIPVDNNTTQGRNLLPSPLSIKTRDVVNHSPWELRNGSHSSNSTPQSQADSLIAAKDNIVSSTGATLSPNGELNSQTKNTSLSPSVQHLFDSFRTNDVNGRKMVEKKPIGNGTSTVLTNEKGIKFPGRRVLAPSFSFSFPMKNQGGKIETHFSNDRHKPTVESSISNVPVNKTVKSQSKKTADVMVNDSAIVSISMNDSGKSAFGMSEFDLGFEDNDTSRSPVVDPVSESRKSLLDSRCPSDDTETIKLKDQLNENVLKLEELQQTFNKYPQRRRKRLPDLFDDHAR